jgi:hypothetical protein
MQDGWGEQALHRDFVQRGWRCLHENGKVPRSNYQYDMAGPPDPAVIPGVRR